MALRAARRTALIPYFTAGYPTRAVSLAALHTAQKCGADFVEVGIPFSDPLADGPVIQRSQQVALEQGMTVAGVLDLVREAALDIPVIAFGYLNPVLAYGFDRFLADAAEAGVSGLLVTDLPAGEDPAVERAIHASPLARIPLVAPTTPGARLRRRLRHAEGFVYLIARLGVTGARTELTDDLEPVVARIRRATRLPIALGFGIRDPVQARQAARFADGIVVGSELVRRLDDELASVCRLLGDMRAVLDEQDG